MSFYEVARHKCVWYLSKMLIEIIANKIFPIIQVSRPVCCRLKSNEGPHLSIISPSLHPLPFLPGGQEVEQEAEEDPEAVQIPG